MPSQNKYTDPKLRDEVKEEIKQGDKGGEPGQWSARKAQMMAKEYKNRGGDYNTDKSQKDESQKNLTKWGDEDWQTKEGSGDAKQDDGSMKRYLPKKAWDKMSEAEKKQTDDKKQKGSKEGKQFVQNTGKAKNARKNAGKDADAEKEDEEKEEEPKKSDKDEKPNSKKEQKSASPEAPQTRKRTRGQQAKEDKKEDKQEEKQEPTKKQKSSNGSSKKATSRSATVGSKHDKAEPPAQQASLDRLPKKGQEAYWKAMPGWVDGQVVEIVKTTKKVDGKDVKGTKDDPKIVLKSSKSGKICVHNVSNVYFD